MSRASEPSFLQHRAMVYRLLTIAGSDSSGGAGIEADLKTFTVHGCYGMTCITALTAQNTTGVKKIYPIADQAMIRESLEAVFSDVGVDVVKMGMLSSPATMKTVVDVLKKYRPKHIVIDPVMVATSGDELTSSDALEVYIKDIFPLATVITPNYVEAKLIANALGLDAGTNIKTGQDGIKLAKALHEKLNCEAILLKGGHGPLDDNKVVDVLWDGNDLATFSQPWVDTHNTHGTGCTLAAALASNLAKGESIKFSCERAIQYVRKAIETAEPIGHGKGPVNHLHSIDIRPYHVGSLVKYLINHPKVAPIWQKYVHHPFTKQIAKGTVDEHRFKKFLIQDYLYLIHYSRAQGLAAFKTSDIDALNASARIIGHIREEMKLHLKYCEKFGLSTATVEATPENQACKAYTRYILDVGNKEDWLALQVALSPCLFGYLEAARHLNAWDESVRTDNPYWYWVESYIAEDYVTAARTGEALLETHFSSASSLRVEELVDIFANSTQLEVEFWDSYL